MYRIIGNMTGNSMDAIDLVLTEFDGNKMKDICVYTKPYTKEMQEKMEILRNKAFNKTKSEIEKIPCFKSIHDQYIKEIADCINDMCKINNIDKKTINAIGFHGKTLDHNPPSKAKKDKTQPYTLQIGSGQMLADLTSIPVIYDFRSDLLMAGFEGAPLVPPHNAHISTTEGNGCYYNGGNTSNFAIIENNITLFGSDAGPFNEYTDNYIRQTTNDAFDKDGIYGKNGKLNKILLQKTFDLGRDYYETILPKSGDPAYYHKKEIFEYVHENNIKLEDAVHTFEYFSAYISIYTLALVPTNIKIPDQIILFGGGWKNPIVMQSFNDLLNGKGYILEEHKTLFNNFLTRIPSNIKIKISYFSEYMEARLIADLARYKLENKVWELPEVIQSNKNIICGTIAHPTKKQKYNDLVNRACKGW